MATQDDSYFIAALNTLTVPLSIAAAVRKKRAITDFRIEFANQAAADLVGARAEDFIGGLLSEISPGFTQSELFASYVEVVDSGTPGVIGPFPFAGEVLGREIVGTFITDMTPFRDGFVSLTRDVTKAHQLEEALLEAQEIASVGSWEWDLRTNEIHWSPQTFRIFGVDESSFEATYEAYLDAIHPDDRASVDADIRKAQADNGSFDHIARVVRPTGEVVILHARGRVVLAPDGTPLRMVGTGHDVTSIREREEALARAESELDRRRDDQKRAAEINDRIIDALVRATQALDDGRKAAARSAMSETLKHASRIVIELSEGLPRPK